MTIGDDDDVDGKNNGTTNRTCDNNNNNDDNNNAVSSSSSTEGGGNSSNNRSSDTNNAKKNARFVSLSAIEFYDPELIEAKKMKAKSPEIDAAGKSVFAASDIARFDFRRGTQDVRFSLVVRVAREFVQASRQRAADRIDGDPAGRDQQPAIVRNETRFVADEFPGRFFVVFFVASVGNLSVEYVRRCVGRHHTDHELRK